MVTIISLKRFKNILSLFICLLLIFPGFNHAKGWPICQTVPEKKNAFFKNFSESKYYLNQLAIDYGNKYRKIMFTDTLGIVDRIRKLKTWRKDVFLTFLQLTRSGNIYSSSYFLVAIYRQKEFNSLPNDTWCANLKNLEGMLADMATLLQGNFLFLVSDPPYEMLQFILRYKDCTEEYLFV